MLCIWACPALYLHPWGGLGLARRQRIGTGLGLPAGAGEVSKKAILHWGKAGMTESGLMHLVGHAVPVRRGMIRSIQRSPGTTTLDGTP